MAPNRNHTGPTADTVSAATVVEAIRNAPQPVVNTRYLAGEFDADPEEILGDLRLLVVDGVLEHLEIRGQTHLWWLSLEEELEPHEFE